MCVEGGVPLQPPNPPTTPATTQYSVPTEFCLGEGFVTFWVLDDDVRPYTVSGSVGSATGPVPAVLSPRATKCMPRPAPQTLDIVMSKKYDSKNTKQK